MTGLSRTYSKSNDTETRRTGIAGGHVLLVLVMMSILPAAYVGLGADPARLVQTVLREGPRRDIPREDRHIRAISDAFVASILSRAVVAAVPHEFRCEAIYPAAPASAQRRMDEPIAMHRTNPVRAALLNLPPPIA